MADLDIYYHTAFDEKLLIDFEKLMRSLNKFIEVIHIYWKNSLTNLIPPNILKITEN